MTCSASVDPAITSRERRTGGRQPDFEKKVDLAEKEREYAGAELRKARKNQEIIPD